MLRYITRLVLLFALGFFASGVVDARIQIRAPQNDTAGQNIASGIFSETIAILRHAAASQAAKLQQEKSSAVEDIVSAFTLSAENTTVRVGRWMSQAEADAITASGKVQVPLNGSGQIYVTTPPNPSAFSPRPPSNVFLEFDVPKSSLRVTNPGEGWSVIDGPGSLMDRFGISKGKPSLIMPPAKNPIPTASAWPSR